MNPQRDPPVTLRNSPPWRVIAAIAGVLAIIVVVVALSLSGDDGDRSATTGASASPSGSVVTPSESEAPAPSDGTPDPTSSPVASQPAVIPDSWTAADTFSESGKRYVVEDLTTWNGGLVAVGTRYEEAGRGVFGPPPAHSGRIWRSTNGTDWTDATPGTTFDQVELRHLFESADGALIAIGDVWIGVDRTSEAWESADGESWEPVALGGMPTGAWVLQVASGAKGHVAATYVGAEAHALFSADGRSWGATLADASFVNALGAGDEGFVASIHRGTGSEATAAIVASSDGLAWFDGVAPDDGGFLVAPRGGDWFATTTTFGADLSVATWQSANGLDWSALGEIVPGAFDAGGPICSEAPGALHGLPGMIVVGTILSGGCGEGAVIAAGASYASLDGIEWTRLPFGDQAFAAGAAEIGDRIVVATDARTNTAETIGVTFWLSEAP